MEDQVFQEVYTLKEFCALNNVDKIDVVKNPNTGKLFFAYGAKGRGAVGKSITELSLKEMQSLKQDELRVGEMVDSASNEVVSILFKNSERSDNTVLSLTI